MTYEDEEFSRIEMESRIRQEGVRAMQKTKHEPLKYTVNVKCGRCGSAETYDMTIDSTPPQRTWIGLTEEQRTELRSKVQEYTPLDSVKYGLAVQYATEQKLKELNT